MQSLKYWIALHQGLHLTPRTALNLLKDSDSPQYIFESLPKLNLTPTQRQRLNTINWQHVDKALNWAHIENQHIITYHDHAYPSLLKQIPDPPLLLYIHGDPTVLQLPQLAIVGSRQPTHLGRENAHQFAYQLAKTGLIITSGMALGIDSCAHQGALAANTATIAILGCGVDVIYPKSHRHLATAIIQKGALVSEYPLGTAACAENFPRRNRIISGLSQATLVVEATIRSGSLISARLANEQNRDVLAIPGSIHNPQSKGCHYLIKQGAALVDSVEDVLAELKINTTLEMPQNNTTCYDKTLDSIDSNLLECVGFETRSAQYLVSELGISAQIVGSRLLKLELRGYIKAVPGGYSRVKL